MLTAKHLSRRVQWGTGGQISYLMREALARPELISLAAGFVDQQTLPVSEVRQAVAQLLDDPVTARAALQYGTTAGDAELRGLLLARLRNLDGAASGNDSISIDRVIVTAGSNELLHLLGDALLDPGDIVLCTAPSYFVYLDALAGLGARSFGVQTDGDGMVPEALEQELDRLKQGGELPRVKAVYLTSYYDNPQGTTLPGARRKQIVEIVRRWSRESRIWIIEDAAYRDLRYAGADEPSLLSCDPDGEMVIHTSSFSKSFSPGIRVGWGVLPPSLVEPVLRLKGHIDFGSPHFFQRLMAEVLRGGMFDAHLARLHSSYREKLTAMLATADEHLAPIAGVRYLRPCGGLYVWVVLPESLNAGISGPLFSAALEEGVLYVPGAYCFPQEGMAVQRNTIRLSFGVQPPDRIQRGIKAMGRAIRRALC